MAALGSEVVFSDVLDPEGRLSLQFRLFKLLRYIISWLQTAEMNNRFE
jgi:hypothetical protein